MLNGGRHRHLMSTWEIDNIIKMQLTALSDNDPRKEDYYFLRRSSRTNTGFTIVSSVFFSSLSCLILKILFVHACSSCDLTGVPAAAAAAAAAAS